MINTDLIPLSALNHYAYCPRRCGLIHVEGEFTDNVLTTHSMDNTIIDLSHREGLSGSPRSFADYPVAMHRDRLPGGMELIQS